MRFRVVPARRLLSLTRFVALGLLAAAGLQAVAARAEPPRPPRPGDTAAAVDPSLFKALKWRSIGPYRGGRALAVSGVPGDPDTFYFGAVAGGVWKTTDGGATWRSLTDGTPISSIGAIAVAPSNPNIIYVGTGEAAPRGDITYGDGVYKSIDGGKTWTILGLADTPPDRRADRRSRKIPTSCWSQPSATPLVPTPSAACSARPTAAGPGPRCCTRTPRPARSTSASIRTTREIVYAALWQARRQPWNFSSGGPGSGLYRSTDGGVTWTRLSGNGLPAGILGRIDVSVSGADSRRVYAMIEAAQGGLYRSDDGGVHWQRVNDDGRLSQRAWYFSKFSPTRRTPIRSMR